MGLSVGIMFVIMAVVAGWLLKQTLNTTPWVARSTIVAGHSGSFPYPAAKIGLWVFLAVVTSLFALFISAYTTRMELGDWRQLPEPPLLWFNTAILVFSSIALQWARYSADNDAIAGVRKGLAIGGVLTICFMVGQLIAWRQLGALGYHANTNPANGFFYLITGLHGLHMLGGLVAWCRPTLKVWRGCEPAEVRLSVELCTAYWHFLLVIWFILFGLMLST
jgi:cytochrome c oxidase subunit 3